MIHPSYSDLMKVVNSEIEESEHPVVQSRYSIVIATAKRARQIIDGEEPLVNGVVKKPLSVAVEELYEGKVKIVGGDDDDDDEEMMLDYNNDVLDIGLGEDVAENEYFDDEDEDYDEEYDDDEDNDDYDEENY